MEIYAEWILYGKWHIEFFDSWEDFYAATFNPDCEVKVVREMKRR